ncbi:MAG TPA: hypothetical protein P5137_04005, partial [Candidatus Brocadiia bacterium]|nr:hypothetical protein [Candidatus Brocadiia bacterium]
MGYVVLRLKNSKAIFEKQQQWVVPHGLPPIFPATCILPHFLAPPPTQPHCARLAFRSRARFTPLH